MTVFRCVAFASFWAAAALAPVQGTASNDNQGDEQTLAFGATIIDIALTFDAAARQSLGKASDTNVPATMMFRDASGADQAYDVTIHLKGQFGSKRSLNSKPAFKVNLGGDHRFFGLKHLTLNNMVQDATMIHEALGYHVYEAAGCSNSR